MDNAFQYVIDYKGIDTVESYPYNASEPNTCKVSASNVGATISGYTDVIGGSVTVLLAKLLIQPVSVVIDAFDYYIDKLKILKVDNCMAVVCDDDGVCRVLITGYSVGCGLFVLAKDDHKVEVHRVDHSDWLSSDGRERGKDKIRCDG